jgi:hypothetical protein
MVDPANQPTDNMASPRAANTAPSQKPETFESGMRYELADPENRPLLISYVISFSLGLIFLLLVFFGPKFPPITLLPPEEQPIEVRFDPPPPEPTVIEPVPSESQQQAQTQQPTPSPAVQRPTPTQAASPSPRPSRADAIGDAFGSSGGSSGMVGDPSNILGGVAVSSGGGAGGVGAMGGAGTGRAVLGTGQGGQGSTSPGRGGIGTGTGAASGGIGGVGGGTGVSRAAVAVSAPRPVDVDPIAGPGRDVSGLGNIVRSRESQLRHCYVENGLKVDPNLAGTITVAISIAGSGSVTGANITNRSWRGPGAAPAESCITSVIRRWTFPSSERGAGTYAFTFNFTR